MKEFYYELIIQPEHSTELFTDIISNMCNTAVEETDGCVIVRAEDSLESFIEPIREFSESIEIACVIKEDKKKNEDWIKKYQESVKAIEVGEFYVRPSWDEPREDLIDMIVDPALSFGSGHHGTTNACLQAISKYVNADDSVIDVGCGSGILAIAASKKGANVDICDTDDVCIKDSEVNFSLNSASYNKAWVGSATKANATYDVVIANIVADVLIFIASDLKKCLKEDGILIISGILDKHLNRVQKKFEDLETVELIQQGEWCTVVLKK